ncbi:MAG: YIP1 family protein [Candidatus Methanoperedens sp.]|nr:YIP1 family protein [Candidatus Methanoperedens sp.]
MDFVNKVKGFLTEPSKTFDASKEDTLSDAVQYYAIIVAIYSLLFALLFAFAFSLVGSMMGFGQLGMMTGTGAGIGGAISIFIMLLIFGIIGAFIGGAILHIFVYIVGGRKGIAQTIKAVMYGSTPGLLFGWIPVIGFIASIWSLILEILGIRQLHELTTGRAVLAVLIPVVIMVVLTVVLAAIIASYVFMGVPGRGY